MTQALNSDDHIHVIYGDRPKEMVQTGLSRIDLAHRLDPGMTVGLKPNLVVAKPSHSGATTSVDLIEGVIEYLIQHGIRTLWIMESSGIGHSTRQAFKITGLEAVAGRYDVRLIDLKDEASEPVKLGSLKSRIFATVRHVDFLINMPVVKAHSQTRITCALKNLKGIIPDSEKRKFHSQGLHLPIALLNGAVRPDLIIADGIQGDLTFEEGGTPVRMDRVLIAEDPVLLDSYVASLIGYRTEEIRHLVLAEELGIGRSMRRPDQVVELNEPASAPKQFARSRSLLPFEKRIEAREACSVCYGSLIHALQRLKRNGRFHRLSAPIHIGQGYQRVTRTGIGIGTCARGFSRALTGCPPSAVDILKFLDEASGKTAF